MAGKRPFFITGSNVKIKVNGKTMAFCTDLNCTVQIITQTPKVLGKYEGSSVEPLGYSVSGSFTLIRYAKSATDVATKNHGSSPDGTSSHGNGVGNWTETHLGGATDIQTNPGDLSNGSTFDIEVYQKLQASPGSNKENLGILKIRNARITQADFSISKRDAARQRFSFVALYVDEDSFKADFSGLPTVI